MNHDHETIIIDSDKHFIIDPITRTINTESPKLKLMQYDHKSERYTFEIPKIIEGHDMTLCNSIKIHYLNSGSSGKHADVYEVDDIGPMPDNPDKLLFSWLIKNTCTKFAGTLGFAIRFYCILDDGIVDYSWGTDLFTKITVSNGMENTEQIIEDYSDLITQIQKEIKELGFVGAQPKDFIVTGVSDQIQSANNPLSSTYDQIKEAINLEKNCYLLYNDSIKIPLRINGENISGSFTSGLDVYSIIIYPENTYDFQISDIRATGDKVGGFKAWNTDGTYHGIPIKIDPNTSFAYAALNISDKTVDDAEYTEEVKKDPTTKKMFVKKQNGLSEEQTQQIEKNTQDISSLSEEKIEEDYSYVETNLGEKIKTLIDASGGFQEFDSTYYHHELIVESNQEFKYTGRAPSNTFPALVFLDAERNVIDSYPKPINIDAIEQYDFSVPDKCTILVINTREKALIKSYLEKKTYEKGSYKNNVDKRITSFEGRYNKTYGKIYDYKNQEIEIIDGLIGVNGGPNYPTMGTHAFISVEPYMKLKVTCYAWSSNVIYPAYTFMNENNDVISYFGEPSQLYEDIEIQVPEGATKLLLNGKNNIVYPKISCSIYEEISLDEIKNQLKEECVSESINYTDNAKYDLNCAEYRILKLEKLNDFIWDTFDKAYFIFVIDDANEHLGPTFDLFHSKSVPLSSAAIVTDDRLNKVYTNINPDETRSVKDILNLIVEDGGEVLAHYGGNLSDPGHTDEEGHVFLTTEEDWLLRTRDVKRILEENGFVIRGIIRADYTQTNSETGEKYCRKYFDYSDNLGKSTQYNIYRKFFNGFTDVEKAKEYIDQKSSIPGIYPFCLHGTETVASIENLTVLIDYIKSKGDGVEISTYANVFDKIGTTRIDKLLKQI